jgi:hypothetical protein
MNPGIESTPFLTYPRRHRRPGLKVYHESTEERLLEQRNHAASDFD